MAITGLTLGGLAAGAAIGMASGAGIAALRGGNFKDILKGGLIGGATGAAGAGIGGAVSGAAGSILGSIGGKIANAGTNVAAKAGTEGVKATVLNGISKGLLNIGSKMQNIGGVPTSGQATTNSISSADLANISNASNATKSISVPLPGEGTAGQATTNISATADDAKINNLLNTKNPTLLGKIDTSTTKTGTTVTAETNTVAQSIKPASTLQTTIKNVGTGISNQIKKVPTDFKNSITNMANSKIGQGIKKGVGQVGVQGLLSFASGIGATKTASQANKIQQQSLLFQQQTYQEQKEKQDAKEAQLKTDAWNAYQAASLFGEKLYNSGTNTLLFTKDYKDNPTGGYGILSGSTGKLTDYT